MRRGLIPPTAGTTERRSRAPAIDLVIGEPRAWEPGPDAVEQLRLRRPQRLASSSVPPEPSPAAGRPRGPPSARAGATSSGGRRRSRRARRPVRSTRWQGTTIGIGLVAIAVPTARLAFGLPASGGELEVAARSARRGRRRRAARARAPEARGTGASRSARSKWSRRPSKYSSSSRRTGVEAAGRRDHPRRDAGRRGPRARRRSSPKPRRTRPASVAARSSGPIGRVGRRPGHVDEALGLGPGEGRGQVSGRDPCRARRALARSGRRVRSSGHLLRRAGQAGPHVLPCRGLAALEAHGDLGVGQVGEVAQRDRARAACRAARPTAAHRSPSTGTSWRSPSSGRSATGTGRRAVARWWSSTLGWAIVNSHPRRFDASRRSG